MYSAYEFAIDTNDMIYSKDNDESIKLSFAENDAPQVPGIFEIHQALFVTNFVPQNSAWTEFAKIFKLGAVDLDKLALNLGIEGGYSDLEMFFNPKSLYNKFKIKFLAALQVVSNVAKKYNIYKLEQILGKI